MLSAVDEKQCVLSQDMTTLHYNASQHLERKICPVVTLQHGLGCHEQAYWNFCMSLGQLMLYVVLYETVQ